MKKTIIYIAITLATLAFNTSHAAQQDYYHPVYFHSNTYLLDDFSTPLHQRVPTGSVVLISVGTTQFLLTAGGTMNDNASVKWPYKPSVSTNGIAAEVVPTEGAIKLNYFITGTGWTNLTLSPTNPPLLAAQINAFTSAVVQVATSAAINVATNTAITFTLLTSNNLAAATVAGYLSKTGGSMMGFLDMSNSTMTNIGMAYGNGAGLTNWKGGDLGGNVNMAGYNLTNVAYVGTYPLGKYFYFSNARDIYYYAGVTNTVLQGYHRFMVWDAGITGWVFVLSMRENLSEFVGSVTVSTSLTASVAVKAPLGEFDTIRTYSVQPDIVVSNGLGLTNCAAYYGSNSAPLVLRSSGGNYPQLTYVISDGTALDYSSGSGSLLAFGRGVGGGATLTNSGSLSAYGNYIIGDTAGYGARFDNVTAIGYQAGREATLTNSFLLGSYCGQSATGLLLNAVGLGAGQGSVGEYNNFIGVYAGAAVTGSQNFAMGDSAGRYSHKQNTISIGNNVGYYATGTNNVYVGRNAGYKHTGSNCTFLGNFAPLGDAGFGSSIGQGTNINNAMLIGAQRVIIDLAKLPTEANIASLEYGEVYVSNGVLCVRNW